MSERFVLHEPGPHHQTSRIPTDEHMDGIPPSPPAADLSLLGPVPHESALIMPTQRLWRWKRKGGRVDQRVITLTILSARIFVFGGAILLSLFGINEMVQVVRAGGIVGLEWPLLILFSITYSWIAFSCMSGIAGFIAGFMRTKRPDARPLTTRTALVMPVYNESPSRTFGALEAMGRAIADLDAGQNFEIFIISDTTDFTIWIEEEIAFERLRHRLSGRVAVWYRRRHKNTARKAGNVADFVTRWGGRYEHMLVLDADSIMSGETLVMLAQLMEDDAQAGIIQTLPVIVNRNTLFARMQQFAGRIYGPVIARGLALWHGRDGNYWGHNAIIRTKAFADCCGLPDLIGPKPFGGHIMSHDFVEAALIRRGGWGVYMIPWLSGSFEESPPSLLDVAARDRRWAQGNLQHIPVMFSSGLAWPSRVHFATGIMSYLASPIWLALLLTGLALALQARFIRPEYFTNDFSLFPAWPRFDSERALQLFVITMGVLLLPKVLGTIESLLDRDMRKASGGGLPIVASLFVETLLSALVAPVSMLIQSRHVIEILSGRDSGWKTQRRDDGGISFGEVMRQHWQHVAIGLVMTFAAYVISPAILAWMAPTLVGLVGAAQISWASGSADFGMAFRRLQLLMIPEELSPPSILTETSAYQAIAATDLPEIEDGLAVVVEDRRVRDLHERLMLPPPLRARGKPELDPVMAAAKIAEAVSMEEALIWLTPKERMAVLAQPPLVAALVKLKETPDLRGAIMPANDPEPVKAS